MNGDEMTNLDGIYCPSNDHQGLSGSVLPVMNQCWKLSGPEKV